MPASYRPPSPKDQTGEQPPAAHRIEITSAKRSSGGGIIGVGHYFASYKGEVIGEFRKGARR